MLDVVVGVEAGYGVDYGSIGCVIKFLVTQSTTESQSLTVLISFLTVSCGDNYIIFFISAWIKIKANKRSTMKQPLN